MQCRYVNNTAAGSQFLDGDGRFPNHIPNPENAEAMAAGCDMVKVPMAALQCILMLQLIVPPDSPAQRRCRYH